MKYILINYLANNSNVDSRLKELKNILKQGYRDIDLTSIDIKEFISHLEEHDELFLLGGDGTINIFINKLDGKVPNNNIYLFSSGTGNDFLNDVEKNINEPFVINKYLQNLPKVKINDKEYYFINGVGFGIDGYCCQKGDELKKKSKKKINYTMIAIKGLLFHFKPRKAKIIIDDKEYKHEYVWIAASMKGRYYGGGMKVAPSQDRFNENNTLSNVVYKTKSKLKALMVFPSIFKGEHIRKEKVVKVVTGKKIKVIFDKPTPLQVDGETFLDVISYEI